MLSQNNPQPVISNAGDGIILKQLILKAKAGDKDAFAEVYSKLYTPLYRYVISKCHDVELTQDVCQQTFLKFFEALSSYEPDKTPLAYLFTIAKRLLINHHEKKTFEHFDETLFDTADGKKEDELIDELDLQKLAETINTFLPNLTKDEEDVIRLHFYSELSHKEISEILEKEEAYIRKIKERALKKLRILTRHINEQQQ